MKRVATAILLMLSLAALLLAGGATADDAVIRLPAGQGEDAAATEEEEETRPWDCCNWAVCTRSVPPLCRCKDVVEQCFPACKSCKPAKKKEASAPKGYMCRDAYHGYPGPKCMH